MYRRIEWRDGWPWVQSVPGGAFWKASADLHDELLREITAADGDGEDA